MSDDDRPLLKVHRRQYVLGPKRWALSNGWRSIRLGSVVLSCCPELRLSEVRDAEGAPWVILGLALQTAPGAASPTEQIGRTPTADVPELRHDWAGRWLLVSEGRVHPDLHAQIGVLTATDHGGRPWASSSPVLLRSICGNAWQPRKPTYQTGMGFFPVPSCALVGARRLIGSQRLDPRTGETGACELLPAIPAGRDEDGLLDEIAARLRTGYADAPAEPMWLGLTAGGDSRVVFAAALAAGADVRPFTWVAGRTPLCDRLIPPRLAAAAGVEHTVLRAGPIDRSRRALVVEHAGPRLSTGDAVPLLRGARLGLTGLCTGGQCIDAWKAGKVGRFPAEGSPAARAAGVARFYFERRGSLFAREHARWLEHADANPIEGLRYESRWSIEQSGAAWQAAKEQLYDMQRLERFTVTNCGRLTSLMLALDFEKRRARAYEMDLVWRLRPELADLPRNPGDEELVGRASALAWRARRGDEGLRQLRLKAARARRLALIRLDEFRGGREG